MEKSADVVSQTVTQLSPILSSAPQLKCIYFHYSPLSPAKVIDNRSKCYKQLGELMSLNQAGILSDDEYGSERKAIMEILESLGTGKY